MHFVDKNPDQKRIDFNEKLKSNKILRAVSYTHLRAHETPEHLVCRLLLEKKKYNTST